MKRWTVAALLLGGLSASALAGLTEEDDVAGVLSDLYGGAFVGGDAQYSNGVFTATRMDDFTYDLLADDFRQLFVVSGEAVQRVPDFSSVVTFGPPSEAYQVMGERREKSWLLFFDKSNLSQPDSVTPTDGLVVVPLPGAVALAGLGVGLTALLRRRLG